MCCLDYVEAREFLKTLVIAHLPSTDTLNIESHLHTHTHILNPCTCQKRQCNRGSCVWSLCLIIYLSFCLQLPKCKCRVVQHNIYCWKTAVRCQVTKHVLNLTPHADWFKSMLKSKTVEKCLWGRKWRLLLSIWASISIIYHELLFEIREGNHLFLLCFHRWATGCSAWKHLKMLEMSCVEKKIQSRKSSLTHRSIRLTGNLKYEWIDKHQLKKLVSSRSQDKHSSTKLLFNLRSENNITAAALNAQQRGFFFTLYIPGNSGLPL